MSDRPILHVVRWWLAEPATDALRARTAAVVRRIAGIPGVQTVASGGPTTVGWAGPDQSWDIGFTVRFADRASVDTYMTHPVHAAMVALAQETTARIDVFYLDLEQEPGA